MTAGVDAADAFAASRERFETVASWLGGAEASGLEHAELEDRLDVEARELFRRMFQDHLDLRAHNEARLGDVVDADGVARPCVESGHRRGLCTIFGAVVVSRRAYRHRGHTNLHPADGALNLPVERHSHGLRRLAAIEASRGSFDAAVEAVGRATGQTLGKRQVEELTLAAADDFNDFYATRSAKAGEPTDVLVVSCDGKGIVMRPDALREPTAKAAANATPKLAGRLSKGEKRNRKRMAEVGAVYDITPGARTPDDIFPTTDQPRADPPAARNKWLTASVVDDAATVVTGIFDEANRRDPDHQRTWIALVDGNNHQIDRIRAEAAARQVNVPIVIDFVHVIEYLWKAAWSFHKEGDPDAEAWVRAKALEVLAGHATRVAGAIRRKATYHHLDPAQRANADICARYLTNKASYLDYPTALTNGWPIATGVIEGACRSLVKDRMDITGARWGLDGAEAILKLRALRCNGDFNTYWQFHLTQERQRTHQSRYADSLIPLAA